MLWSLAVLLLAVVCLGSAGDWFLSDDYVLIGEIARSGPYATWGRDTGGFLRPLTILSLSADYGIGGLSPLCYHLTGTLLHILCAIGVGLLAGEALGRGSGGGRRTALAAGLLFLVLPSHSEPLCWISGRADLLAGLFGILSVLAYLRSLRLKSRPWGAGALLFLALGLGAKESLVTLPLVWLASGLAAGRRPGRRGLVTAAGGVLVLGGYLAARKMTLGVFAGGLGTARHAALADPSVAGNLVRYLLRVFVPPLEGPWAAAASGAMLLLLAGWALAALIRSRLRMGVLRVPLLWGLCFLVALIPVLSLAIGVMDTQSERYLYLPGAFACIGLVSLVRRVMPAGASAWFLAGLTVVSAAGLYSASRRWGVAADLSRRLSAGAARLDPSSDVIINLPDHYRGAYVFRNGLEEACTVFGGAEAAPRLLYLHGMEGPGSRYGAELVGGRVKLVLPDTSLVFERRAGMDYYLFDGRHLRPAG
jgi:hypothetical protein